MGMDMVMHRISIWIGVEGGYNMVSTYAIDIGTIRIGIGIIKI